MANTNKPNRQAASQQNAGAAQQQPSVTAPVPVVNTTVTTGQNLMPPGFNPAAAFRGMPQMAPFNPAMIVQMQQMQQMQQAMQQQVGGAAVFPTNMMFMQPNMQAAQQVVAQQQKAAVVATNQTATSQPATKKARQDSGSLPTAAAPRQVVAATAQQQPQVSAKQAANAIMSQVNKQAEQKVLAKVKDLKKITLPVDEEDKEFLPRDRLASLVKEVCGGPTSTSVAQLTGDGVDAVKMLADNFVSDAIDFAISMARRRNVTELDPDDFVAYFKSTYNIEIPGFGNGQVKPYRRLAPSTEHTKRMAAVRKTNVVAPPGLPPVEEDEAPVGRSRRSAAAQKTAAARRKRGRGAAATATAAVSEPDPDTAHQDQDDEEEDTAVAAGTATQAEEDAAAAEQEEEEEDEEDEENEGDEDDDEDEDMPDI